MVRSFTMLRTPKIIFGEGKSVKIPSLLRNKSKILVITGSESYYKNKEISALIRELEQSDLSLKYARIAGEPSPGVIDGIVEEFRKDTPDAVVSVGGGSALDTGKAVSAMLTVEGTVQDYLEGVGEAAHPGTKIYFMAVPTTSGTGSEATSNAVISQTGKKGFKKSLRHENFVPDTAIVDPVLMKDCPSEITASSGMDAFTQLVESYLSTKSQPITDSLALEGIRKVRNSLYDAVRNGNDISARSDMAYAALLSGITLANAGLGLIHGFASSVGGCRDIPHGVVCGTLMGIVNRYNIEQLLLQKDECVSHEKYARIGKILSRRDNLEISDYMKFTADYIDELTEKLHLKRLGDFGISKSDLPGIARVTDHKANPVQFSKEILVEMLEKRL